jgi:hypothetical protein
MHKLVWIKKPPSLIIYAALRYDHNDAVTQTGLREDDIAPVQFWCEEHKCGRRMSFNMFKFRTKAELSMFLLKWG